jgi:hypothetical protein
VQTILLLCALAAGADKPTGQRPKLAVFEVTVAGGIDPQVAGPFTEALTTEIASRGFFDVISSRDVQALLGAERQRQIIGCSEQGSCLTELAGAIGARFVLNGSLAKLGDTYQLTLQGFDSVKAQPLGRSTHLAKDLSTLRAQLPWAVAEATGTPLPAPPSHVLPYTLIGVGAAAIIGGAVLGLAANNDAARINDEFSQSDTNAYRLPNTASYYQSWMGRLQVENGFAIAAIAAGAAAIGLGLFLNPAEGSGGARVALVPTRSGVGLAGSW